MRKSKVKAAPTWVVILEIMLVLANIAENVVSIYYINNSKYNFLALYFTFVGIDLSNAVFSIIFDSGWKKIVMSIFIELLQMGLLILFCNRELFVYIFFPCAALVEIMAFLLVAWQDSILEEQEEDVIDGLEEWQAKLTGVILEFIFAFSGTLLSIFFLFFNTDSLLQEQWVGITMTVSSGIVGSIFVWSTIYPLITEAEGLAKFRSATKRERLDDGDYPSTATMLVDIPVFGWYFKFFKFALVIFEESEYQPRFYEVINFLFMSYKFAFSILCIVIISLNLPDATPGYEYGISIFLLVSYGIYVLPSPIFIVWSFIRCVVAPMTLSKDKSEEKSIVELGQEIEMSQSSKSNSSNLQASASPFTY